MQAVGSRSMTTIQPINGNPFQTNQANTTLNNLVPQQGYGQQPVSVQPQSNLARWYYLFIIYFIFTFQILIA